jgi:hypothetical protein
MCCCNSRVEIDYLMKLLYLLQEELVGGAALGKSVYHHVARVLVLVLVLVLASGAYLAAGRSDGQGRSEISV